MPNSGRHTNAMKDSPKVALPEAIVAVRAAHAHLARAMVFGTGATGANSLLSDVYVALFGDHSTLPHQARYAAALGVTPTTPSISCCTACFETGC